MAYDMTRCPQTEQEFRDYFYTLIGRAFGAPASNWEEVMEGVYEWQGAWMKIPPGVGPGIKADASWPFYGLTQQYSGGPKGRVFLPSNTPDDLGYYTRCMQYLDDAAAVKAGKAGKLTKAQLDALLKKKTTQQNSGALVWAWYLAGPANAYSPVLPADGVPPNTGGGGGGGLTEAQVQAMIDASLAPLTAQIAEAVKRGEKIGLRMAEGQVLCAANGGPKEPNQLVTFESRNDVGGAWEELEVL
jgi:hypothetical protein